MAETLTIEEFRWALEKIGHRFISAEIDFLAARYAEALVLDAAVSASKCHEASENVNESPRTQMLPHAEAPPTPAATKFFALCDAEHELDEALMRAMGATVREGTTDSDTWPCRHIVYDDYDGSFELWNVKADDWHPTSAQLAAAWALGFAQCWICYPDQTERWYHRDGRTSDRHKGALVRDSDQKYRLAKRSAPSQALRVLAAELRRTERNWDLHPDVTATFLSVADRLDTLATTTEPR